MDFDDETYDVDDELPDCPDVPDFRATVQRSGAVRLVYWGPWLQSTGPAYTLVARRARARIAVADLRVVRDDEGLAVEVIVEFHSGGRQEHKRALGDWAGTAGYQRARFDDEVIDLMPTAGGFVCTRCTGCGERFVDGTSGWFWRSVRCSGAFPVACALCGSDRPQWTSLGSIEPAAPDTKVRQRVGASDLGPRARRR